MWDLIHSWDLVFLAQIQRWGRHTKKCALDLAGLQPKIFCKKGQHLIPESHPLEIIVFHSEVQKSEWVQQFFKLKLYGLDIVRVKCKSYTFLMLSSLFPATIRPVNVNALSVTMYLWVVTSWIYCFLLCVLILARIDTMINLHGMTWYCICP